MEEIKISWAEIQEEASQSLSKYIQIDTTNPPGNELAAAQFLKELLEKEGLECQVLESEKGRGNLITRLKGEENKPPLLLLHHLDVVPAEAEKWHYPPFSGKIIDNEIWGRGALDCKSLGIMEVFTLILLKRIGFKPKREIILAATADEETGGKGGVGWLMENHYDLIKASFVINEGGGIGFLWGKGHLYLCQTGEKGVCWMRITFKGKAGHASIPPEENCIEEMARFLKRVSSHQSPLKKSKVTFEFVKSLAKQKGGVSSLLLRLLLNPLFSPLVLKKISDKGLRQLLKAMLHNTFVPTVVKGGKKTNVVPSECFCEIDSRMLPEGTPERMVEELKRLLRDAKDFEVEVISSSLPTLSSPTTPLYQVLERNLKRHDPKGKVIPYISAGASDSRFFREKGMIAYGFSPLKIEGELSSYLELVHGHNERISLDNLLLGIKVLFHTVKEFCED